MIQPHHLHTHGPDPLCRPWKNSVLNDCGVFAWVSMKDFFNEIDKELGR